MITYALDPPFDNAEGNWVEPRDCKQKKSFGHFRCTNGHTWTSAHAFNPASEEICKQACQKCNEMQPAWCMWKNSNDEDIDNPAGVGMGAVIGAAIGAGIAWWMSQRSDSASQEEHNGKPHQTQNCERCRRGLMCTGK